MLFAALLRCTSYNGNAIFSGNQSISFAQDSTVRAEYLVRAGLDGSRRVSRSRRTRRFEQVSTGRAGLDGSRRTRRFSQTELDGSRRTRRFAQDSTLLAATAPHTFWPLCRLIFSGTTCKTGPLSMICHKIDMFVLKSICFYGIMFSTYLTTSVGYCTVVVRNGRYAFNSIIMLQTQNVGIFDMLFFAVS